MELAWTPTPARQALLPAPALAFASEGAEDPRRRRAAGEGLLSLAPLAPFPPFSAFSAFSALSPVALGPPTRTPPGCGDALGVLREASDALESVAFPASRAPTARSRDWPQQPQGQQLAAGNGRSFSHGAGSGAFEDAAGRRELLLSPAASLVSPTFGQPRRSGAAQALGVGAAASVALPAAFMHQQLAPQQQHQYTVQQQQPYPPLHAHSQPTNAPAYDAEAHAAAQLFLSLSECSWRSPTYNQRPPDLFAQPQLKQQPMNLPLFTSPVELFADSRERNEHMETSLDIASRAEIGEDLLNSIAQQVCGSQVDRASTMLTEYESPFSRLRTTTVPPTRAPIVPGSSLGFRHLCMADILNGSSDDTTTTPEKPPKKKRKYTRKPKTEPQSRRKKKLDAFAGSSQLLSLSGRNVSAPAVRLSNGFRPVFAGARDASAKMTTPLCVPLVRLPATKQSSLVNLAPTKRNAVSSSLSSASSSPARKKNRLTSATGAASATESIGTPDKTSVDAPSLDSDSVKTWSSDEASGNHHHLFVGSGVVPHARLDDPPAYITNQVPAPCTIAMNGNAPAVMGCFADQEPPPKASKKRQRNPRRSQPLTIAMKLAMLKMNEAKRSIGVDVDMEDEAGVNADVSIDTIRDVSAERADQVWRPKKKSSSTQSALQEASPGTDSYMLEPPTSAPIFESEAPVIPEANTVVMFCRRDFMRYQAVKLWRKYQEQQQKQQWRAVKVEGKRTRYLNAKYELMLPKPKK